MKKEINGKRRMKQFFVALFVVLVIQPIIILLLFWGEGKSGETISEDTLETEDVLATTESSGNTESDSVNTETEAIEDNDIQNVGEQAVQEERPAEYLIEDFPIIYQMPELPTGCEITSLTMLLEFYDFSVDKTVMASQYLPTASLTRYYGEDGRLYGTDMNQFFIGSPFSDSGIICGTMAIVTAAEEFLQDEGSSYAVKDITGSTAAELYDLVSYDQPVLVWVTISMADRREAQGWYTESGEYVDWSTNDHCAVLIGYSCTDSTVTLADPISGIVEYSREQFEEVFESRGNQCVVIEME